MSTMKKICLVVALSLVMLGAKADDFGGWANVGLEQNLGVKGLDANLDFGFRSANNMRNVDRWSVSAGLEYSLCRYLKVASSYTYMYGYSGSERKENYKSDGVTWEGYNLTHAFWRSRNRFSFDLKTGIDLGRFSLSLRERYQLTGYNSATVTKDKYRFKRLEQYDPQGNFTGYLDVPQSGYPQTVRDVKESKSKEYLRSKFAVSYNIRHCPLEPSLSIELENNLREGFNTDEIRYVGGLDWKITKKIRLGAYYHYNKGHDDDADEDLHAVEVTLKLKNIFWKAKK